MAVKVLERFKDAEVVVIASGSCGAMMKVFYPELFAGTPARSAGASSWPQSATSSPISW